MTKKIVYRNDREIESTTDQFNRSMADLQAVCDTFSAIGVGTISSRSEYLAALTDPERYLQDEATRTLEKQSNVSFRLKRSKITEIAELPDPQAFYDAVKKIADDRLGARSAFHHIGTCSKSGKVSIDKKLLDKFIEENSVYAETPKELEIFDQLKKIADAANKLVEMGLNPNLGEAPANRAFLAYNRKRDFAPNLQTFRKLSAKK